MALLEEEEGKVPGGVGLHNETRELRTLEVVEALQTFAQRENLAALYFEGLLAKDSSELF